MLAKVGKTLLEYGTIPWTSELHTWRSWGRWDVKPSCVPQLDAGAVSGGGPAVKCCPYSHFPTESSQLSTSLSCYGSGIQLRTQDKVMVVGGWVLLLLKSGRNSLKHIFPAPRHPPHPSKCGGHAIVCTAETDAIY